MLKYGMKERINSIESTVDLDCNISQIIMEMNFRRGHGDLSGEEIRKKIYSVDPNKRGEYWEFMEEWEVSDRELTPDLALEMADIIYYTSQKNCPEDVKLVATELEEKIGISHEEAQEFCILKYRCRLEQPLISKNYKEMERDAMSDFLNNRKLNFLP
jgi:hypothetical protein